MKKPNELGIYDMSGNVREFTADAFGPYPDCKAYVIDGIKVARGGSIIDTDKLCTVYDREEAAAEGKFTFIGLRLVMDK